MRRFVSLLVNLLVALLIFEGFFVLVYYLADGEYVAASTKIEATAPATGYGCLSDRFYSPHPYLGFTRLQRPDCRGYDSRLGHNGKLLPRERDDDYFTILVLGASVIHELMTNKESRFGDYIAQHYRVDNKPVRVIDATTGSWKQPQQLIMLMHYAALADAVVAFEGYNELLFNRQHDYAFALERPIQRLMDEAYPHDMSKRQTLLVWLTTEAYYRVQNSAVLQHSKLVYFVLERLKGMTNTALRDGSNRDFRRQMENLYRVNPSWSLDQRKAYFLERYDTVVAYMHALSSVHTARFVLFLQPTPLTGKVLTDTEQARVRGKDYLEDYLLLEQSLLALNAKGIRVVSLKDVFEAVDEEIYRDTIHLDKTSVGPAVLARAMLEVLVPQFGLIRHTE